MPNAPETARNDQTGSSRPENIDQVLALFSFPALYDLGKIATTAMAAPGSRGRRPYPPTALLAAAACARIAGSTAGGLKILRRPDVWEECRRRYLRMTHGQILPATPPNREQVDYFRERILNNPAVIDLLDTHFTKIAVAQARHLGNLLTGVTPDWTNPDERHTIYGDGTNLRPYSDVRLVIHPGTGEVITIGSRAQSPATARIQEHFTKAAEDGKQARGINFVAMHTWTLAGRIVLGTATALRAEQWAALDLIDRISAIAGDGVHTVVYDRALTGWHVDYLMATHRLQLIGKAVSRSSDNAHDADSNDPTVQARVNRLAAEYGEQPTPDISHILRRDTLADLYYSKAPMPLGTSLYPTERSFDYVQSRYHVLEPVEHSTPTGTCRHELAVDDGSLFLLDRHPLDEIWIKVQHLPCINSEPVRRTDGRWGTRNTYLIPCEHGDHTYTRTWEPTGTRYTQDSPETDRAPADMIGCELRPLARPDGARFGAVTGRRNDAESYNQWFQDRLPHHGRAATLSVAGQALDFLLAGLVNNSNTWSRR
jgi:hypothetical protein